MWADVTRGLAVVAVVLFHVLLWTFSRSSDAHPLAVSWWGIVNKGLGSLRMPVLLATSGLVVAHKVRAGLHRATTWRSGVSSYYLYVVWLLVYAVVFWASTGVVPDGLGRLVSPNDVLVQLVAPGTTLWYLLALAVYVVVLSLVARVRPWLVLGVLTAVSVCVHLLRMPGMALAASFGAKIPELFIFFAAGVYGAAHLRSLATAPRPRTLLLAASAAGLLTAVGLLVPGMWVDAFLFVPQGLAFIVTSVLLVASAQRWERAMEVLAALGRRTLSVYVLHPILLAVVIEILSAGDFGAAISGRLGSLGVAVLYPVVLTAVVVVLCLGLQTAAEKLGLRFLFAVPRSWRARVAGLPPPVRTANAGAASDRR